MSTLMRFFVQIGWRSNRTTYYCAVAESGEHAIELVTGEDPSRATDVVAARAWTWDGSDGPRVKLDAPRSFRLGSRDLINATIDRLAESLSAARIGAPQASQAPQATLMRPGIAGRMSRVRGPS